MQKQTFLKSVNNALNGIFFFFKKERNSKIQLSIALFIFLMCYYFNINKTEWLIVCLCITIVIGLEMINSAIEKLCDAIHPETHPLIKQAKDIAAGAVLWACIISGIIGAIIFFPKL
ncbi:MAG: diacylglycerol kinase family protein [Bacteroidetes bacterium]|nr:diacylglycerol kinase family protein [Bacteroidota bacterium]MBS1648315.1 diacylglycerol kinase family protein [Bacteroidota bacterium]